MGILDFVFPKRCVGCKRVGGYVCDGCFAFIRFVEGGVCFVCGGAAVSGLTHPGCRGRYTVDGVFSSIVYAGVVKRLIFSFKFRPYVSDIAGVLGELFWEGLIQKEGLPLGKMLDLNYELRIKNYEQILPVVISVKQEASFVRSFIREEQNKVVLVPVPLYRSRLRERGYNQAELLARELALRIRNNELGIMDNELSLEVWDCLERGRDTRRQVGLSREERRENIRGAFGVKRGFEERLRGLPEVFLVDDIVTTGATMLEAGRVLKRAGVGKVWGVALAHGE